MSHKVKFEWTASGTVYLEVVQEDDLLAMMDKNSASSAPCDLEDLPPHIRTQVETEILNTVLDNPVEIVGIAEVTMKVGKGKKS